MHGLLEITHTYKNKNKIISAGKKNIDFYVKLCQ